MRTILAVLMLAVLCAAAPTTQPSTPTTQPASSGAGGGTGFSGGSIGGGGTFTAKAAPIPEALDLRLKAENKRHADALAAILTSLKPELRSAAMQHLSSSDQNEMRKRFEAK